MALVEDSRKCVLPPSSSAATSVTDWLIADLRGWNVDDVADFCVCRLISQSLSFPGRENSIGKEKGQGNTVGRLGVCNIPVINSE